jgi:hypothetical protein
VKNNNPAVPIIWFVVFVGAFALMLPDSSLRDGLFAAQIVALFAAVYGLIKHLQLKKKK